VPDEVTPSGKAGIVLNPQETESELKLLIKDALIENFRLSDDPAKNVSRSVRPLPPSLVSVSALANLMEARECRKRHRENEPDKAPAALKSDFSSSGSHQTVDMLKGRFQGLFLWPYLLGRVPITPETPSSARPLATPSRAKRTASSQGSTSSPAPSAPTPSAPSPENPPEEAVSRDGSPPDV